MIREAYIAHNGEQFGSKAIYMSVHFYFPVPKSATRKRREWIRSILNYFTGRPDIDNLAKSVMDALNGIAYIDDSQICCMYCSKRYSDERSGVELRIESIEEIMRAEADF